jgi:hypothetical protein
MSTIQPVHPNQFDCLMPAPARPIIVGAAMAIASIFGSIAASVAAQAAPAIGLTQQQPGMPPTNFQFWRAGQNDSSHWTIVRDPTAAGGVSIQQADSDKDARSALAVYDLLSLANAKVRVGFKLIDGSMPSAGIAVRVTSPDDYYLVRVSAFEERLSFIHVVHGEFEEVAGVDAEITQDHWQTLEVAASGDHFTISLDDRWALTVFDRNPPANGNFALWTEKDSVARFDQLQITPLTLAED